MNKKSESIIWKNLTKTSCMKRKSNVKILDESNVSKSLYGKQFDMNSMFI